MKLCGLDRCKDCILFLVSNTQQPICNDPESVEDHFYSSWDRNSPFTFVSDISSKLPIQHTFCLAKCVDGTEITMDHKNLKL